MDTPRLIFDIVMGLAAASTGFLLRVIWERLSHLGARVENLVQELSQSQLHVAEQYVRDDRLIEALHRHEEVFTRLIQERLSRIDNQLDALLNVEQALREAVTPVSKRKL